MDYKKLSKIRNRLISVGFIQDRKVKETWRNPNTKVVVRLEGLEPKILHIPKKFLDTDTNSLLVGYTCSNAKNNFRSRPGYEEFLKYV